MLFFAVFFLYLWLSVDLRLIYHGGGVVKNFPVFYTDFNFFARHLSYPGGIVGYITAFLAQFWFIGWAGAIVVTLTAWSIYIFTDRIFKLINAPYLHLISFTGPIILLVIFTRYVYHFDTAISLLASLVFVVLYLQFSIKQERSRVPIFLVLSLILYYLGGRSYALFAILCGISEVFFYRRWKHGLIYLVLAVALAYIVEGFVLGFGYHDVLIRNLPIAHSSEPIHLRNQMPIAAFILFFMLPVILLVTGIGRIIIYRNAYNEHKSNGNLNHGKVILFESLKITILFITAYLAVFFSYSTRALVLKADYYICRGQWPEVIQTTRKLPKSLLMVHMANRALYHTGRLGYDMFTFPQSIDVLLLNSQKFGDPESRETVSGHWKRFGTYIDLGFLNLAQHSLIDCLEMYGPRPVVLKNLAIINMAKGNYDSARVYLGVLNKTLFHSDWAKVYLDKLKSNPTLDGDKEVQRLRNVMIRKNYDFNTYKLDEIFADSLNNRMAFEYMMTSSLLGMDLVFFMKNIHRLNDFNYPEIPRLYEEAILLYMYQTKKPVNLHGYKVSKSAYQRFEDFLKILTSHEGNKEAARGELTKKNP